MEAIIKTIIAGSRTITRYADVRQAIIDSEFEITEVVSGTARGVDQLGETFAKVQGIPIKRFPADWNNYGRSAGPRRNKEMAKYADALIAVWDGESTGTAHMIQQAKRNGLKVFIYKITGT